MIHWKYHICNCMKFTTPRHGFGLRKKHLVKVYRVSYTTNQSSMEPDEQIAKSIVRNLGDHRDNPTFSDVVITAGSREFRCHRVILASVSSFFKAALTHDMREAREGRILLKAVDEDVFSKLLDCIYRGEPILTEQNLLGVWRAADMLQIPVILKVCEEKFQSLLTFENCIQFLNRVKTINETARRMAFAYIVRNFEILRFSKDLHLIDAIEMNVIVSSNDLFVACEEDVLATVLIWADKQSDEISKSLSNKLSDSQQLETCKEELYESSEQENSSLHKTTSSSSSQKCDKQNVARCEIVQRCQYLVDVLEHTRYLLVSNDFLIQTLSSHSLVRADGRCQAIVDRIWRYQSQRHLHQTWRPLAAVNRHAGKTAPDCIVYFRYYSFLELCYFHLDNINTNKWHSCDLPSKVRRKSDDSVFFTSQIFFYEKRFYLVSRNGTMIVHCPEELGLDKWKRYRLPGLGQWFCDIGEYLYSFEKEGVARTVIVKRISFKIIAEHSQRGVSVHKDEWQYQGDLSVKGMDISCVTSIGNSLIVFWHQGGEAYYTTECYDLYTRTSSIVQCGPPASSRIVTIRKEGEAFALQSNGCLWRICLNSNTKDIELTFELRLWLESTFLNGAVLFNNELLVVGEFKEQYGIIKSLDVSLSNVFGKGRTIKNMGFSIDTNVILARGMRY